jgi:hypothetical protein
MDECGDELDNMHQRNQVVIVHTQLQTFNWLKDLHLIRHRHMQPCPGLVLDTSSTFVVFLAQSVTFYFCFLKNNRPLIVERVPDIEAYLVLLHSACSC